MKKKWAPYAFVSPSVILLFLFGFFPIILAAFVSFTNMNLAGLGDWSQIKFIGTQNYQELFADSAFWQAVGNTAIFVVIGVPALVVLSLAIALLLNQSQGWFFRLLRSFYFVPAITAIAAVALVWNYLYNSQFGLINYMLSLVGAGPVEWLSDPIIVKFSVALVAVWRGIGMNVIIFLAGLQGVPKEYIEAAQLDGASNFRITISIVIPLLKFALFFVMLTTLISWLQFFDEPYILTKGQGGPLGASTSISLFIFQRGFRDSEFGYASAGSIVIFLIIAVVTVVQLVVRSRQDEEM